MASDFLSSDVYAEKYHEEIKAGRYFAARKEILDRRFRIRRLLEEDRSDQIRLQKLADQLGDSLLVERFIDTGDLAGSLRKN